MQREKVRVYALARELNMESKDLLDICRAHGLDVKNQLSSIEPEVRDQIELLVKKGGKGGVALAQAPAAVAPLPTDLGNKVRVLPQARRTQPAIAELPPPAAEPVAPAAAPVAPPAAVPPAVEPAAVAPAAPAPSPAAVVPPPPVSLTPPVPPVETKPTVPPSAPVAPPPVVTRAPEPPPAPPSVQPRPAAVSPAPAPAPTAAHSTPPALGAGLPTPPQPAARAPQAPASTADLAPRVPPTLGGNKVPTLGAGRADGGRPRAPRTIRPNLARPPMIATPPPLKSGLLKKKPDDKAQPKAQTPISRPPESLKPNLKPQDIKDVVNRLTGSTAAPPPEIADEEEDAAGKAKQHRPGIPGRDARHKTRTQRQAARKDRTEEQIRAASGRAVAEVLNDDEAERRRKQLTRLKREKAGPKPRIGATPIEMPITVRSLSEAIGAKVGDLLFRLHGHGAPPSTNINSTIDPMLAEVVAHDLGVKLEIKRDVDVEALIVSGGTKPDRPEDLVPRAPIVTIMGHVDHGKTTLLDKIRAMDQRIGKSDVAAGEAGGITQVIRAWRVQHNDQWITFLDTPGHEAFTKMRARGANVTDIAVIVVAADDAVMPQTEEAISHAKAAGVSMVVCINKIDLPNANINKTRQQLYGLGVLPDNMGGDIPFVETSAVKGTGIDELLEQILLVAELKELKANPNKPGSGTCLEAMLNEGEGVNATLLVREGTLHKGDVILCGASYGRARAMYDDLGQPIEDAGPSVPVRITGLDTVPNADDPFHVAEDLVLAREAAEQRADRTAEGPAGPRTLTLEELAKAKIPELKIILKADFRGSIEAIKKEMEKLSHKEVRVNLLHSAIGGITESDVALALTSPQDTIIVGFNVVPDDRARALAEDRGVQIREYDIIYNLTDDIKQALEGKLKPHEEVVHLGRAVVRQTFKIGRVGTIAGCYVTQGTIERSAKIRLIRQGVVIYPPTDRTASLESLKRFKDDAREVREGFECGIKIAGYDDIKKDDVIEAYRIEQVQRSLEGEKK